MIVKFGSDILLNASAEEIQTDSQRVLAGREIERKHLAGNGLLRKSMFSVDPTQSILTKKNATAIASALQIGLATKFLSHLFTDLLGPPLRFKFLNVPFSQLDGEISTTITTTMTAVLLPFHSRHENWESMR